MQCSVDGCTRRFHAKGLCSPHYRRFKLYGDPLGTGPNYAPRKRWILAHVDYQGDDCISMPWVNQDRPSVHYEGARYTGSRLMCILAHGEPPDPEMHAAHSCGNGHLGCANPNHLSWKTKVENEADRIIHQTTNRGERCGSAKLTTAQATELKARAWAGEPYRILAEEFGVCPSTISKIKLGKRRQYDIDEAA